MRRAAVALLFVCAALSPAAAYAAPLWSSCSTATANRVGYTTAAPVGFTSRLRSTCAAYAGAGFDASGTVGAWAGSAVTGSSSAVTYGVGNGKTGGTVYTATPGEPFAVLIAWAHLKDPNASISEGGTGQYAVPRINGSAVITAPASRRDAVLGNESNPYGGYGYSMFGTSDVAAVEASSTMPASRWQMVRTFTAVVGKWDAASSSWRVRSRVFVDDGMYVRWGQSREATYSVMALSQALSYQADGYEVELSHNSAGKMTVTRPGVAGNTLTNVELYEAVVTTDAAQVAAVWDKTPTLSTLEGIPTSPVPVDEGLPGDEDGSTASLSSGWQNWFRSTVLDPVTGAFDHLTDLLWFIDPVKEWFGLGD